MKKILYLLSIAIVFTLLGCGTMTTSPVKETPVVTVEKTPEQIASDKAAAEIIDKQITADRMAADVKAAAAVEATTPTPAAPPVVAPSTPPKQTNQGVAVFVTETGAKYHRDGCRYLSKSIIPINLSDAKSGYEPCSVCNPPQ